MSKVTINVNQLNDILKNHFECQDILIEKIEVANIKNQWKSETRRVGVGGILDITFNCKGRMNNVK